MAAISRIKLPRLQHQGYVLCGPCQPCCYGWTFVGKVMSLLLNILSRLVITFLPRSKCLLISWLQSPSAVILEPQKIKSDTVSTVREKSVCRSGNLYAGQEATVRTGHGTTDWFQIGKGVCQGCILSPCLLNLYAEYIRRNAGLE